MTFICLSSLHVQLEATGRRTDSGFLHFRNALLCLQPRYLFLFPCIVLAIPIQLLYLGLNAHHGDAGPGLGQSLHLTLKGWVCILTKWDVHLDLLRSLSMQEVICVDGCPHQLRQGFLQRLHNGVPGIQGSFFFLTLSLSIIQLLDINAQSAGTDYAL